MIKSVVSDDGSVSLSKLNVTSKKLLSIINWVIDKGSGFVSSTTIATTDQSLMFKYSGYRKGLQP